MENLEIICGDSLEELKKLPDKSIDLIVTDPPYNLGKDYEITKDKKDFDDYINWTRKWLTESHRILKDDGTIYVFMGVRFISYLFVIMEQELGMKFNSWITWRYTQGIGKTKGFSNRHEDILMFTKSSKFNFYIDEIRVPQQMYRKVNNMRGSNPSDVWEFPHIHYNNKNREYHPTQKPEGIYERIIRASSKECDTVLDMFCGSGTSLRVCQQLNRKGIGIEINPNYVENIKKRLEKDFHTFDSIDKRLERVPTSIPNKEQLKEYINNHIEWFIKDNPEAIKNFIKDIESKYGHILNKDEIQEIKNKNIS